METWIIGVLPLSTGCQKECVVSVADGVLDTISNLLGEVLPYKPINQKKAPARPQESAEKCLENH